MADNVVDVKLKAQVDTKDIQKEMQKIARDSKTAIEQSYKNLDLTMRKSVEALGGDLSKIGRNINFDAFVDSFKDQMQDLYKDITETGNLPINMSTKLLDSMQNVDRLIDKYYQLIDAMSEIKQAHEAEQTAQISNIEAYKSELETALKLSKDIAEEANKIASDYKGYQSLVESFSFTRGKKTYQGEDALQDYENRKRKIEEIQAKIEALQQSVRDGLIPSSEIKSTTAEINKLQKSLQMLTAVQSQLNSTSAEYLIGLRDKIMSSTTTPGILEALRSENPMQALTMYANDYDQTVNKITSSLEEMNAQLDKAKSNSVEQNNAYRSTEKLLQQTGVEIVKAAQATNELAEKAQQTKLNMSQMRNVVWSISRVLGNVYTLGLDMARSAKQVANIYKTIWGYVMRVVNAFKKLRDNIKKSNEDHAKSWKQMLRDVIRYSLGIRSLFALFRRLRKYIKEAFEAMAEQIPAVNATLSELKSSFNQVKASLATALEPIISALASGIAKILALFSQLLTYVGMFFAAFSGRSYVYQANKSMTSFADSAGGAAKNMKELNKQLQGFDELNNLTTKDDTSGGGGGGPLANFEKAEIPDWIKNLADKIKDILKQIWEPIKRAWDKMKDYVINAWKAAFTNIKLLFSDILRDFLIAWKKWGEPIFINIFKIVGDIGYIIANIASALRRAWNENENGVKIWNAILEIVYKITEGVAHITQDMKRWTATLNLTPAMTAFREWLESLVPIADTLMGILYDIWHDALRPILDWAFDGENSGIARFFGILRDFNKKVNWQKLRTNLDKIWKAIGRFGQKVGEGLLIFIERLSDRLADWVNSDDFERTCDKIVEFFDNVKPEDIADDLDQILTIMKNLVTEVWDAVKFIIDHKDEILDTLEWVSKHLKGILATFITFKSVIDFARFGANIYLMVTAIEKLLGAGALGGVAEASASAFGEAGLSGAVAGAISKVGSLIGGMSEFMGIVGFIIGYIVLMVAEFKDLYKNNETFRKSVDDTIALFKDNIGNVIDNLKEVWDKLSEILDELGPIKDAIRDAFGEYARGIFALFGDSILLVTGALSGLSEMLVIIVDLISGDFDGAVQHLSDLFNTIKDNFKQMASNIVENIDGISRAISLINPVIAGFIEVLKDVIRLIGLAVDKIRDLGASIPSGSTIKSSVSSYITSRMPSVKIPGLANGAVIPPNNEFLAVLGDQKSGTNIESPLSTMVEAFNMANKGGNEQELALLQEQNDLLRQLLQKEFGISENAIFNSVRKQNSIYTKSNGVSAFA